MLVVGLGLTLVTVGRLDVSHENPSLAENSNLNLRSSLGGGGERYALTIPYRRFRRLISPEILNGIVSSSEIRF
jgi:hypothetical protein